jgi:acetyl esterase
VNLILGLERRGVPTTGTGDDVTRRRNDIRRSTRLMVPVLDGVRVANLTVPGPAGPIPVRVYRNPRDVGPVPAIVYYHGGGWVVGDLDTHDAVCRILAAQSGCVVASVDYSRAPETPFPAPLDDALAAFRYVRAHPEQFAALPGAVAVMGDSAGGNLAAAVSLVCRDEGAAPVAQCLIYPATDLRLATGSVAELATGFLLTKQDLLWYRDKYLPDPDLVHDPRVSPLLADDLSGLPPTYIWTAGFDPLRDEGLQYAQRLAESGVPVTADCHDDQVHGFFGMGLLPGGLERIEDVCRQAGATVRRAVR